MKKVWQEIQKENQSKEARAIKPPNIVTAKKLTEDSNLQS